MLDTAVVGASTSGLYSALLLARRGLNVEVFERAAALDPARRTLITTARLRDYVDDLCDDAVINEINGFEAFANGKVGSFPLDRPDLVVERSDVIGRLAEMAQDAGVRLRFDHRFTDANASNHSITTGFQTTEGRRTQTARHLIGADGARSTVAGALGWLRQPTVPLLQARVALPAGMPSDVTRVWFHPNDTPYFYWLIPESRTVGAVGLIGKDRTSVRRHLTRFMSDHKLQPLSFQSAQVPEYAGWIDPTKRFGGAHAHLVGDAAGHVKVSTVGGLVTGFRGAIGLAESVLTGGKSPELRRLRRELNAHLMVKAVLHRFEQEDYVRLIELLERAGRARLACSTRDEAPRVLTQVLLSNPRIGILAARAVLAGLRRNIAASSDARSPWEDTQRDRNGAIEGPPSLHGADSLSS